jgi:colicin import membrane protein
VNIFKQIFRKKEKKMDYKELETMTPEQLDAVIQKAQELKAPKPVVKTEAELETERLAQVEAERLKAETVAEEARKQAEAQKLADEQKAVEDAKKKEETIKANLLADKKEREALAERTRLAEEEAKRLAAENAELRRTQPTGIPGSQVNYETPEVNSIQQAHDISESFMRGYGPNKR